MKLAICLLALLALPALATAQTPLPRTGWTVTVDSDNGPAGEGPGPQAIDGNRDTYWHSEYTPTTKPQPHWIVIDMKAVLAVGGLMYLPRQDWQNGRVARYEVHVSADGKAWGTAVATGAWPDGQAEQRVTFGDVKARYVRLTGLSNVTNEAWMSVAEVNVLGAVPLITDGKDPYAGLGGCGKLPPDGPRLLNPWTPTAKQRFVWCIGPDVTQVDAQASTYGLFLDNAPLPLPATCVGTETPLVECSSPLTAAMVKVLAVPGTHTLEVTRTDKFGTSPRSAALSMQVNTPTVPVVSGAGASAVRVR